MNWQHFKTFVWLRWRLNVNQLKRGAFSNQVLLALLGSAAVLLAVVLFVAALLVGLYALGDASASVILYVWDGVVLAFLFIWAAGVMSDLQRSEDLSLDKFLHLPVSLSGAFIVNYFSSFLSLTLLLFVPAMLGLSLGLAIARGPTMLLLLPALAALLLMVTAVTHQFQGWLASLIVNKRRRQTIIVVTTMAFVLIAQAPNMFSQWSLAHDSDPRRQILANGRAELQRALSAHQITQTVFDERLAALQHDYIDQTHEAHRQMLAQIDRAARLASLLAPPGWLPLSAMTATQGKVWPALLGTLGMTLLGVGSLWRSYRTTLRFYTGQFNSGRRQPVVPASVAAHEQVGAPPALHLLERQLLWLPEQASAIALSSFRSLMRAPEIKMVLLSPIFMLAVMGPMLMRSGDMSEAVRPLLGFGAMAFMLLIPAGLVSNQFGYDRSGFQIFMLCGAKRRDILLGKNMAVAPIAIAMGLVAAMVVQVILPMRITYFLAMPLELVSMYLLFCLLANWLSIHAPANVPAGALRKPKPTGMAIVLHLLFMLVLFPLAMTPILLPLVAQLLLESHGWDARIPVCLLLSLLECAAIVYIYRLVLNWEGQLLQPREQAIYAVVRTRQE